MPYDTRLIPGSQCEEEGADPTQLPHFNTLAINACLARGGNVSLTRTGTYTLECSTAKKTSDSTNTYNVALFIPSNTTFTIGPGVTLKIQDGVTNPVLIQNSDIVNGNTNICLIAYGSTLDGNRAKSIASPAGNFDATHTFCQITIWMQNVTNLRSYGVTLTNPLAWGFGCSAITNGWFHDTAFQYSGGTMSSGNQGGFQFQGAQNHIFVYNTQGNTYDDLVAFVTDNGSTGANAGLVNAMAGYGAVNDITIDGCKSDEVSGCLNFVRLLDSVANPIVNATIRNVQGNYSNTAIKLGSNSVAQASKLRNINISDVNVQQFGTISGAGFNASIDISGSCESVSICRVKKILAAGETMKAVLEIRTVSQTPVIGSLVVDDLYADTSAGANASSINAISVTNGTVTSMVVSKSKYLASLQTGGNAGAGQGNFMQVAAGATVTDLHIDHCKGINTQRFFINLGTVTRSVFSGNTHNGPTLAFSGASIENRSSMPNILLTGNNFNPCNGNNTGSLNKGVVFLNGSSGTTVIQSSANLFTNGSVANVVQAASEAVRWQGIDVPVPNAALTQAVGDIFLDASNSNNPYRCSTAPSTFTAL